MTLNGFYDNTLHTKAEPPEYFASQARRRPRRQRIVAGCLLLLTPVFVAWAVVDLPRPNTVATVTDVGRLVTSAQSTDQTILINYVWQGVSQTAELAVGDLDDVGTAYPVGSAVDVRAYSATADAPAGATLPYNQPVAGTLAAAAAIIGAVLLLRSARRNERRTAEREGLPWTIESR